MAIAKCGQGWGEASCEHEDDLQDCIKCICIHGDFARDCGMECSDIENRGEVLLTQRPNRTTLGGAKCPVSQV